MLVALRRVVDEAQCASRRRRHSGASRHVCGGHELRKVRWPGTLRPDPKRARSRVGHAVVEPLGSHEGVVVPPAGPIARVISDDSQMMLLALSLASS